ncbi:MAG: adenylate/guanylate cyclase domain-containing protein [Arenicellales bacterium]|nr:adenylate/guanylate cyclase domain-containing protein [Arenicellales bacterium]
MKDRLPRKLAAIFYADVAGYSRLTGEDEDATHHVLRTYLDLVSSTIQSHSGRVVHYAGDAVLADFGTVLDALVCAITVQRELKKRNDELPDERKVQFRIGVNLGDVIVDGNEIYGDGVNVAARLESLAEPGGICISESVRTAVGNKLPLDFEDMGDQRVKNIERSVRAYHSRLKPGAELPAPTKQPESLHPSDVTRRKWSVTAAVAAVALISVTVMLMWLEPWDSRKEMGVTKTEIPQSSNKTSQPIQRESDASVTIANVQAGVPIGKFLSESEIRTALIGNTINFRSPRNGANLFVYFANDGGVAVKGEHNPDPILIHKWFFKDEDIFCRTVLADRRNHCTRVVVGTDVDTLNFINAKKGVFYQATVLKGRQLPE